MYLCTYKGFPATKRWIKNKIVATPIFSNFMNKEYFVKQPKNERLELRISNEKKKELQELADQTGRSMTDIIMYRLENIPLRNYNKENEILVYLHKLTQELGHIGRNINQVTIAIHQINNSQKIEQGEFAQFQNLMDQYLAKRNELSEKLEKIFFK
jgi:hypothetical protein